ncbi:MAG: hypothetical protein AAF288_03055 [Planctomycetota bacterium]
MRTPRTVAAGLSGTLLAGLLSAAPALAPASAQPTPTPVPAPVSPGGAIQPGANLPVPDWVKPGVRLTYYTGSRSADSGRGGNLVRNPNGTIEDDQGNKYSWAKDVGGPSTGNSAGHGYTVHDILEVNHGRVTVRTVNYLVAGALGQTTPNAMSASTTVYDAATGGGAWMHPQVLQQRTGKFSGPYQTITGQDYQAIILGDKQHHQTYDVRSGLLLGELLVSEGTIGNTVGPDGSIHPRSRSNAAVVSFISFRQLDPAMVTPGELPPIVRPGLKLNYQGGIGMSQAIGGFNTPPSPFTVELTVDRVDQGVAHCNIVSAFPGMGAPPARESKTAMAYGSYWAPTAMLQGLRTGQVLDQDATLMTRTVVQHAGPDPQGRDIVTLHSANRVFESYQTFDRKTGLVLDALLVNHETNQYTRVTLQNPG